MSSPGPCAMHHDSSLPSADENADCKQHAQYSQGKATAVKCCECGGTSVRSVVLFEAPNALSASRIHLVVRIVEQGHEGGARRQRVVVHAPVEKICKVFPAARARKVHRDRTEKRASAFAIIL